MNYFIAFWNVESLFDVEDSPNRTDKLNRVLKKELKSWNVAVLDKKLEQLSKIILQMNNQAGPDILGLCEVENQFVLELLVEKIKNPSRKYKMAHAPTDDRRGLDTVFIYDANKVSANEMFSHFIQERTATRDLFQVNFRTNQGKLLVIINNHWPSRTNGQHKTEPFRMMAGETLSYFHERVQEIHGKDAAVLAMGDFNDEPFNRSVYEYANAQRDRARVTRGNSVRFLNLMWSFYGKGVGTCFADNTLKIFDQFMISKGLISGKSGLKADIKSVKVLRFSEMSKGSTVHAKPVAFGQSESINKSGYSDHFPIAIVITD